MIRPVIVGVTTKETWVNRYESLRTALSGSHSESWGMVLVARKGLTAWMYAWPPEKVPVPASPDLKNDPPSRLEPLEQKSGLIALLTGMLLATRLGGAA